MTWFRTVILLLIVPAVAFAEEASTTIRQEAQKCAKALADADYEGVVKYTPARVVKQIGGKKAMIAVLQRGMGDMKSQGITIEEVTIGESGELQPIGSWTVAFVPQRLVLKSPKGTVVQESHLLGISEDDGKIWTFVDCSSLTKEKVAEIFPELTGKIELPAKKKPVLTKSEK